MKRVVTIHKKLMAIALFIGGLLACNAQHIPYNLNKALVSIKLNKELNEISGLQALNDSVLIAIQDENGILYYLNASNGKIIKKKTFGKDGDYEGVTAYKSSIYILKSNGNIYRIKKGDTKSYHFKKEGNFDFEGLCVDEKNNRLLLACKTHPNKDKKDYIYIYGFDLKENKYLKSPVYKIKREDDYKRFKPSGIAFHPNGTIYILGSTAKQLLCLSAEGELIQIKTLSPSLFHQPEGITFLNNGDLFISNEKRNAQPTLLRFTADK